MRLMALESKMPLSPDQSAVLSRVATQVARSYHRTHPWLDTADLTSEAWVAMLEALPRYQIEAGDLGGYLYPCASRAVKSLCWRLSVAANVPQRSATPQVIGRMRAASVSDEALTVVAADQLSADDALDKAERDLVLTQVVAEHLAAGRHGEAVRAVLTGEAKSAEVAEAAGIPVTALYEATKLAKRRMAADPRIKELL